MIAVLFSIKNKQKEAISYLHVSGSLSLDNMTFTLR